MSQVLSINSNYVTPEQRAFIGDLWCQTGFPEFREPRNRRDADDIIRALLRLRGQMGTSAGPTRAMRRKIVLLGLERGNLYKMPTTRGAAEALLDRLDAAAKARAARERGASAQALAADGPTEVLRDDDLAQEPQAVAA